MHTSVRSTTATTATTVLAIVAILSLLLSTFVMAKPVLAVDGQSDITTQTQVCPQATQAQLAAGSATQAPGSFWEDPMTSTWGATLVVPQGKCATVSLTSYTIDADSGRIDEPWESQEVFENLTADYSAGTYNLTIAVPEECGWQVDLYMGAVDEDPPHDNAKLLSWSAWEPGDGDNWNGCEGEEPGEGGTLEVDKVICYADDSSTEFDDPEFVYPQGPSAQGVDEQPNSGCELGSGVWFDVYADTNDDGYWDGGDEWVAGDYTYDGVWNYSPLAAGFYFLVEVGTDDFPGGYIAFEVKDGAFTVIGVTNYIGLIGSMEILKTDNANDPELLEGAGFTVDGTEYFTDVNGLTCVDGLNLGETYWVEETTVPDGFIGAEPQEVTVTVDADCESRDTDVDATFVNVPEDEGFIKVIKYICPTEAPEGFDNPTFLELEGWEAEVETLVVDINDDQLPDNFDDCDRAGTEDLNEAQFSLDDFEFWTNSGIALVELPVGTYLLSEISPIAAEGPDVTITEAGDIATVLVINFEEEEEPETGIVEIDKFFCITSGEADTEFWVFDPTIPDDLDSLGAEEQQPDKGCWSEEVAFTITGGDLTEPVHVTTDDHGIIEFDLPVSENAYVITEDVTEEWAEFWVEEGALTAILVINWVPEEVESGTVKVIKLYCETEDEAEAGVEFSVEGGDVAVPVLAGCAPGNATFEFGEDTFSVGDDGLALFTADVGEYDFAEISPNAAVYDGMLPVVAGEITTVIVFNTFAEDEDGGTAPGPNEGTAGGNPLPDTATTPAPGGSLPAILLALMALGALGVGGYRVTTEARSRR